jgi:hypothetical protein
VVLQNFNAQLTLLDRAGTTGSGNFGGDDAGSGFSSPSNVRQPAMAGAGAGGAARDDMNDEIPF